MNSNRLTQAIARARVREHLPSPAARRRLREGAGLSQRDIASTLGVTRECVALWELGLRTPRPEMAAAYIEVLERLAVEGVSTA